MAAHAVNLLARSSPSQVAELIDLGQRLRAAQETLSADEMRELGRQRYGIISSLAGHAASLVGGASEVVMREIESTLDAALGDSDVAASVAAGCLAHALERSGLGAEPVVALADVSAGGPAPMPPVAAGGTAPVPPVAAPPPPPVPASPPVDSEGLARAEAAVEAASATRREADQRVAALEAELSAAREAARAAAAAEAEAQAALDRHRRIRS